MDRKDRLEGEEIQKGLEDFLEQELYGAAGKRTERRDELDMSLAPSSGGSDLSFYESDELDISLAKPAAEKPPHKGVPGRIREESVRNRTKPQTKSLESGQREMSQRKKTASSKSGRQDNTKNKKQAGVKGKSREPVKGGNKKQEKAKKKKNRAVKVLIAIAALFVVVFFALQALVGNVYKKMEYKEAEGFSSEPLKEDGVINVLLIGNDSRLAGDDGRSDAMILVSVSDKTKTITMTSLLRDIYVEIPGHDGNRLNAAYSYGGAELLMETIELNFDIPIHRYALVNFQAFANLIDGVGGIDLELTNDEVKWINAYLMEYNQLEGKDLDTDFLDPSLSGMLHLNGPQALAFTRNRYIGTDFGRTERQRKVLSAVMKKLPGKLLTNGNELIDGLFPNLTTNLKQSECFNLSLNAWKFLGYEIVQQCVPVEGTYSNADIRGMAVLQVDFEANKQFLKTTIYGE